MTEGNEAKTEATEPEMVGSAETVASKAQKEEVVEAEEATCEETTVESIESVESVESEIQTELASLSDDMNESASTTISEKATSEEDKKGEAATEAEARKTVILSVDDSPTIRKLVSLTLTKAGYEVISAADGEEALAILANTLPDLVLSDINMPKMGGYKLCSEIKKDDRTSHIPVVMLSGRDGLFDKMRGSLNGCDDFISKPFESHVLLEKVQQNLKQKVVN